MTVLNVASSNKGLDELIYYIVPASWYRKAWRLLLRPQAETIPSDWREQIGELPPVKAWWNGENGDDHRSNDEEQSQKKASLMKELHSTVWKQNKTTTGKRLNKAHEKDFYFIGNHAWTVLKNKFGNASEEGVACHVVSFPSNDSRLAVNLPDGSRIAIPASGRFAYEQSLLDDDEAMEDVSALIRLLVHVVALVWMLILNSRSRLV